MNITNQANELRSIRNQRLSIDRRHFKVIFGVALIFYVIAFSLARLLPESLCSRFCGFEPGSGIIEQASVQANILASYAIMN